MSTTSINTCHDSCTDHEVREILIKRPCCSTSKTELVQYFVEDLYGTARRTSCCTSSDYCYHTDSTSLYGSRSSLSRNNSIKSGSVTMHRKKTHHRQPSYGSLSLGLLNQSHPNSLLGSLTSILDKAQSGSGKMVVSPSKVTIEHQSKNAGSKDLPEYACSPSPIRWSFLADSESKTPSDFDGATAGEQHTTTDGGSKKSDDRSKRKQHHDESPLARGGVDREESTTVVFHQEGEAFNNCCSNYLQCNAFLDHDLQITSEDICEYLSKGNKGEILNNSVNYPFQPSNALEFQYKNNFNMSGNNSPEMRRAIINKETNLSQNNADISLPPSDTAMSPTNINLSSSSNNINIIFNSYLENNQNEVKFINTSRENDVSTERQHSAYLPYTYPNYDYTNMSSNSLFDKPLGIDEIPSSAGLASTNLNDSNIDTAASSHNLLYYRYSTYSDGQQNFELVSPSSPVSPGLSHRQQNQHNNHHHHQHHHHNHHRWQHVTDNLKITNALRRVRKRARKCAQYLRKK